MVAQYSSQKHVNTISSMWYVVKNYYITVSRIFSLPYHSSKQRYLRIRPMCRLYSRLVSFKNSSLRNLLESQHFHLRHIPDSLKVSLWLLLIKMWVMKNGNCSFNSSMATFNPSFNEMSSYRLSTILHWRYWTWRLHFSSFRKSWEW